MIQPKNILFITFWPYKDPLIQTATLPYLKIIKKYLPISSKAFLFTIDIKNDRFEILKKDNLINISIPYTKVGLNSLLIWTKILYKLLIIVHKENIKYIHCYTPLGGAIGYLLTCFCKAQLILDSWEPHAVSMIENKTWTKKNKAFKILKYLEKLQYKKASVCIAISSGMKDYAIQRYGASENKKFYFKPLCVDLILFSQNNLKNESLMKRLGLSSEHIVCVYAGKFGGIYFESETFRFIKQAYQFFGSKFRFLLLTSHSDDEINTYLKEQDIPKSILIKTFVPHADIPNYIGLADFALCPVKPVPTKKYCSPIKNGEYWALGLPIIIPKGISDDSDIIQDNNIGYVWKEISDEEFNKSIRWMHDYLTKYNRQEIYQKIRPIAEKYRNFDIARDVYHEIYG